MVQLWLIIVAVSPQDESDDVVRRLGMVVCVAILACIDSSLEGRVVQEFLNIAEVRDVILGIIVPTSALSGKLWIPIGWWYSNC